MPWRIQTLKTRFVSFRIHSKLEFHFIISVCRLLSVYYSDSRRRHLHLHLPPSSFSSSPAARRCTCSRNHQPPFSSSSSSQIHLFFSISVRPIIGRHHDSNGHQQLTIATATNHLSFGLFTFFFFRVFLDGAGTGFAKPAPLPIQAPGHEREFLLF